MEVLSFIFILGINFSIFGFLWGIIMFLSRFLMNQGQPRQGNSNVEYIFRIIRYFLLVSVTANLISFPGTLELKTDGGYAYIVLGIVVFALYLLGKLQNRSVMAQLGNNPMLQRLVPKVDLKVERFMMLGSIVYFAVCLFIPSMVNNGLINWFKDTIVGIYRTPVIGWIFSIIAFIFLVTTFMRAANVLGRLINGQPILDTNIGGAQSGEKPFNPFEQFTQPTADEEGFTEYEDVTDEEEEKD